MTAQGSIREQQRRERLSARERRMARADRREREAPVAREAILNAAEEIFARDGFDGARVDAIAEASGYNKALIFHYFGDKLGLYREIVCMQRDESEFQRTEMLLAAAGNPESPLDAATRALVHRDVCGLALRSPGGASTPPRIMAWEAAEGWGTLIEAKRGSGQAVSDVGWAYLRVHRSGRRRRALSERKSIPTWRWRM